MEQQSRWFTHRLRVRYQETDQMGVVYHANYMNWFEIGRTELIRELGLPYKRLEEAGLFLPVIELTSKFRAPARYDDEVAVWTRIVEFSTLTIRFESEIRMAVTSQELSVKPADPIQLPTGELLVSGGTKHIWLNRSWKPVRIHSEAPDLFALLEQAFGELPQ
jgi:acyl-CoA thioester hydrolase